MNEDPGFWIESLASRDKQNVFCKHNNLVPRVFLSSWGEKTLGPVVSSPFSLNGG
jgi:hypothetical protein